jgi:two-component system LytT family sensor kinase
MKPPADRRLDLNGTGVDLPAPARPRYGVQWPRVLLVATMLSAVSSMLAVQFTMALGNSPTHWGSLIVLTCSYWYVWAIFTPAIVWLSQHFRLEQNGLALAVVIHLPSLALFAFAHIAVMGAIQWWLTAVAGGSLSWWLEVKRSALQNFGWEMMTYCAIAGLSLAVLYYRESRDRALRASQLETKLVESQLAALQQQMQPHFLFNTLHAISTLMHRDVEAADRTLASLSDLLRMSLETSGQQEVTLHSELDFLAKYLEIERMRFADRLVVRFDIDPEALDTLVPSLLLQPLVENAIKYGVARKAGPGHVDISARRDHDKLWIEIRDDGAGLPEDALAALQKGIGVSTTRARLQHQFGADFRFEFHHQDPGVAVVVALPWRIDRRKQQAGDPDPAPATRLEPGGDAGMRRVKNGLAPEQPA